MLYRWDHIAASVDDRTRVERGEEPLTEQGGKFGFIQDLCPNQRWILLVWTEHIKEINENCFLVDDPDSTKRRKIPKSRYDSISSYLSECSTICPEYNDIPLVHDESIYNILRNAGIQEHMAKHVAHLFIRCNFWLVKQVLQFTIIKCCKIIMLNSLLTDIIFFRDTVSLFGEKINQDDKMETDHFENIQSTNW